MRAAPGRSVRGLSMVVDWIDAQSAHHGKKEPAGFERACRRIDGGRAPHCGTCRNTGGDMGPGF